MYSASAVDNATLFCFLLFQETRADPMNWHVPLVLFLSVFDLEKSEFEYPIKLHKEFLGYHNPKLTVPYRYLMILFTSIRCENFGFDWNLAHMHTLKIIYGLLADK